MRAVVFACAPLAALALAGALAASGCAEVAAACGKTLLEATAQVCVDVLCNEDKSADNSADDVDDAHAPKPREVPPPNWQPREGACDVSRADDAIVRVSCADGTRAVFAPSPSTNTVLVERDEPSDRGCAVIRQGVDGDGDGALSATEVSGRVLDCPDRDGVRAQTLEGHVAIFGPDDVARLAGRRAISGGLVVKSASLVRLELPALQSVGGTLRIDGPAQLKLIALVHLAAVGGDVVIARAPALSSLALPMLTHVGGSVVVVDNPALAARDVDEVVFLLSRHGFAGPVDLSNNGERAPAP